MINMEENTQQQQLETEVETTENQTTETVETETFTKEQVDKMLQQESDRRVNQARAKFEKEFEEKLATEKSEAEKLANMTQEERFKSEIEKERLQFQEERKQFNRERLEHQAIKEMAASSLPVEFSSYLMSNADTAEEVSENIKSFTKTWTSAIEKAVEERLKGSTPKGSNKQAGSMTKEQFNKLPAGERNKMYHDNPEFVKELLAQ